MVAKAKKKPTRKELLRKDDAFISAAGQGARWMSANRAPVIAGAALVIASILGTWGVVEYLGARDHEASLLFKRGVDLLDGEVLGVASDDEPQPDATEPTFGTEQEKWTAARDQFVRVTEETGGSGVASLAGFLAADLDTKLGNTESAESRFLGLAGELGTSDSLYFLAVERAAYLQEARGDVDGALRTLSKLVNVEAGFYNDFASFHQARLYIEKGEESRARNILERIQEDFPSSPILDDVRERLQVLGSNPEDGSDATEATEEPAAEGAEPEAAEDEEPGAEGEEPEVTEGADQEAVEGEEPEATEGGEPSP